MDVGTHEGGGLLLLTLTMLSMAEMMIARPGTRSSYTLISTLLLARTCLHDETHAQWQAAGKQPGPPGMLASILRPQGRCR